MPSKARREKPRIDTLMCRTRGKNRHVTIYCHGGNGKTDETQTAQPKEDFTTSEADVLVLVRGWCRRTEWTQLEPGVFVALGEKDERWQK